MALKYHPDRNQGDKEAEDNPSLLMKPMKF